MNKEIVEVRKSFESSPFFSLVGFEVLYFEEGNVKIKLPVTNKLLNANETLHGGVHATMLDIIMGMTIRSVSKTRCTTINLDIHYIAPSTKGEIYATGKILKQGYKIVTAEAELIGEDGQLLAKGVGTFKLLRNEV
ncbi:PaaI family thioesterase [Oceanobacillus bengalensis]|uniref:PaaI family thioesterase n=1 Tax=Oceanobacillus bengalensis TaxID=1435466 RepID=A0A494Z2D0_9BACI|nr:PaaI family thioesterase [Oceanobacillus bengalensis]RKQ16643.1 PaaI family thioesterase [Oceanobacillus bengalensis]